MTNAALSFQAWINDVSSKADNVAEIASGDKGKARALSPSSGGVSDEARLAKLRASFVVVPSGDEAKAMKCPICKEDMKTEFLEDEEEWVWRNAVSIKGKVRSERLESNPLSNNVIKVYHATCHADAFAATAARLRHEGLTPTGRSRSATPDPSAKNEDMDIKLPPKGSTPGPSPLAGHKRKVSSGDDAASETPSTPPSRSGSAAGVGISLAPVAVKVEGTDSPRPLKKLALGPA